MIGQNLNKQVVKKDFKFFNFNFLIENSKKNVFYKKKG